MSTSGRVSATVARQPGFCVRAYQLAAILTVNGVAGASGRDGDAPPLMRGRLEDGRVSIALAGSSLATNGSAALVMAGPAQYLVCRSSDRAFSVLTAVCTREGCTHSGFRSGSAGCSCQPSASRALASFAWQFDDGVLSWSVKPAAERGPA